MKCSVSTRVVQLGCSLNGSLDFGLFRLKEDLKSNTKRLFRTSEKPKMAQTRENGPSLTKMSFLRASESSLILSKGQFFTYLFS